MIGRTWDLPLPRVGSPRLQSVRNDHSVVASLLTGYPRQILFSFLIAAGYFVGTRIGFVLKLHDTPISTFWPPNAILLAAFLLAPTRMWWIILVAVFPAHLLAQLPAGRPLITVCGWYISNCAEGLLGAALIRHFKKPEELFEDVSGVLVFLGFAILIAPLASSFVDAAVVVSTGFGNGYWKLWTSRLFSNMLADLTVAPTIIVWTLNGRRWLQNLTPARIIEAVLLGVGIVAVTDLVFGIVTPTIPALMFSPLPLVLWIVVRFGVAGLYPSLVALSVISIWHAMHGRDPFIFAPVPESIIGIQIFLCTITLPMMVLAAVLAERKAVEETLRESRGKLIDAQEQERRRIARELHDDIGQQLTLLELELDQLRLQSSESLKPALDKLHRQAAEASVATRTISHELHSSHLEFLGLASAVRNLCETVTNEMSINVAFSEENVPAEMDPQVSLCLYRVAQEALHNIARHSHAHKAQIDLRRSGDWISLHIADDGIGIPADRERSVALGLASMRERVSLVGGTFTLESEPMRGTRIGATIPIKRMHS